MFIGRQAELEQMSRFLEEKEFAAMILYGRRRIGKTELIQESLKRFSYKQPAVKVLYYECRQAGSQYNLETLTQAVSGLLGVPYLSFKNLEQLFDFLFDSAVSQTIVLVLDEYPYLRSDAAGLDSILQCLIDKWKHVSKLKLILSGSYIDTMQNLLEQQNPLYGRFTYKILLGEMDYYDSVKFYPSFSLEDKIRLYSVFGGVPFYNSLIDENLSVQENIIRLIASQNARLSVEVELLLQSEMRKIANANKVFNAIAQGYGKFNKIQAKTQITPSGLQTILNTLMQLGLVKKEAPINDRNNFKKAVYRISDRLALFYYRFIFGNLSAMAVQSRKVFYKTCIEEMFERDFVPRCFEQIGMEYLIRANKAGLIQPPFFEIGKYYYDLPQEKRNGEFDIVTRDENGYGFYEAKYTNTPVDAHVIKKEIQQVQDSGMPCIKYGFISRSGFDAEPEKNQVFICLEQLFDEALEQEEF